MCSDDLDAFIIYDTDTQTHADVDFDISALPVLKRRLLPRVTRSGMTQQPTSPGAERSVPEALMQRLAHIQKLIDEPDFAMAVSYRSSPVSRCVRRRESACVYHRAVVVSCRGRAVSLALVLCVWTRPRCHTMVRRCGAARVSRCCDRRPRRCSSSAVPLRSLQPCTA
jgi:hypothetical protein